MDSKIVLYSTHCAHCRTVELMLKKKNISYEEVYINPEDPEQIKIMTDLGLTGAPGLVVDGQVMDYQTAMRWVREQ